MGSAVRNEIKGSYELSPAPNRYKMLGDFDFRDPTDTKNSLGKVPKFAFGIKPQVKPSGIDVPGPGTYETDTYPMNQQNIAYWIGTDVRRDMSVRNAHMYPGPGHYDHYEKNTGAHIGFTQDKKHTKIIKNDDPGPNTYMI
jgi:hypothetical protein